MQVDNVLRVKSLEYTREKSNMLLRKNEVEDLHEIYMYCCDIAENILYSDEIWEICVEKNITFVDWLYGSHQCGEHDERAAMMEILTKPSGNRDSSQSSKCIGISLGKFSDSVYNVEGYIKKRRDILSSIGKVDEYEAFMRSCFQNSVFADHILKEMRYIKAFSSHAEEITKCLSLLNDEAVYLYEEYHEDLEEAMKVIASKLEHIRCSPDSNHKKDMLFSFTYEIEEDRSKIIEHKRIECSPHLKLTRPDSDLRIYFYWRDSDIADGQKVLVGRIGRHPY